MCAKKKFITTNPDLSIIKSNWTENPLDNEGLYRNLNEFSHPAFLDVLKWQFGEKAHKAEKKRDTFTHTTVMNSGFLENKQEGIIWLGHATFIIHLNGLRIITDPIFGTITGLKRHTTMPCEPHEIKGIDLILLSHNHRDHADKKSMKLLCANNPGAKILTGLQEGNLLKKWNISNHIQEAGWYQQYDVKGIDIAYLPAKHWNRRYLHDLNQMLWGSFIIQGKNKTIYFGADSGYDDHFSEIGKLFGSIDVSIVGCGAYKPSWFMSGAHTSPIEAVKAFHDTGAKTFVPMHIGTFDLGDEPMSEPFRLLREYENEGKIKGELKLLDIGYNLRE